MATDGLVIFVDDNHNQLHWVGMDKNTKRNKHFDDGEQFKIINVESVT